MAIARGSGLIHRLYSPDFRTQCEKKTPLPTQCENNLGVEPGNEAKGVPLGVSFLGEQCLSVDKELVIICL